MVIKSDFYTFSIILLDVHVIRGQSQDRAFREHARISLNLAHRDVLDPKKNCCTSNSRTKSTHEGQPKQNGHYCHSRFYFCLQKKVEISNQKYSKVFN